MSHLRLTVTVFLCQPANENGDAYDEEIQADNTEDDDDKEAGDIDPGRVELPSVGGRDGFQRAVHVRIICERVIVCVLLTFHSYFRALRMFRQSKWNL